MIRKRVSLAALVLCVALIVGCGGPIWLPNPDPGYHFRAYPQPHFHAVPAPGPLYGQAASEAAEAPEEAYVREGAPR